MPKTRSVNAIPALILLALLLQAALPVEASEIEVAPNQSPTAIQNQLRSLSPGSVARLMAGRHSGPLRLSGLRGSADKPIRITAQPGAVLDGGGDKSKGKVAPGSGIMLEKSENVVIEGLTITGFERGITLGGCQGVTVRGNTITDVSNYGVMSYLSDRSTIADNTIERSFMEHGIYVSGKAKGVTVRGNTIRDTHINGIHVNGEVEGAIVADNRLERLGMFPTKEGGAAITMVGGAKGAQITGNKLKDIYGQGMTIDAPGTVVKGNVFDNCAWSDILGLPHALNLRIEGNDFKDVKVVPLQFSTAIVPTVQASGNRYATGGVVCEENESHRTYTLKQWQGIGKDVR